MNIEHSAQQHCEAQTLGRVRGYFAIEIKFLNACAAVLVGVIVDELHFDSLFPRGRTLVGGFRCMPKLPWHVGPHSVLIVSQPSHQIWALLVPPSIMQLWHGFVAGPSAAGC